MTLYDITRPVSASIAVWPGDTPYSVEWLMRLSQGDAVNLTSICLSPHTGTHADAANHVLDGLPAIGEMPLDAYLGPATVLDLTDLEGPIRPEHLQRVDLDTTERLLVHTKASDLADEAWDDEFVYPLPESARLLAEHGLKLFGTDQPSVDPMTSKTMDGHKALARGEIAILERLQLKGVPEGVYELIALPLKLDVDGAPVRAVLRSQ